MGRSVWVRYGISTLLALGVCYLLPLHALAANLLGKWETSFGSIEQAVFASDSGSLVLHGTSEGSGVGQRITGLQPGQTVRVSAYMRVVTGNRPVYLVANGQRLWSSSAVGRQVSFDYTLAATEDTLQVWVWFDGRTPGDRAEVYGVDVSTVPAGPSVFIVKGGGTGEQLPAFMGVTTAQEGDPRSWFGLEPVVYLQLGAGRELVASSYMGPGRALALGSPTGRYQLVYIGVGGEVTTDLNLLGIKRAKARRWAYSLLGTRSAVETLDATDGRFTLQVGRDEIAVVEVFPTTERSFRVALPGASLSSADADLLSPKYHVAFWYPTWVGAPGLGALRNYGWLIDEVNFFWYDLVADGSLQPKGATPEDLDALALAWQAGSLVMPSITNGFNATLTHTVLATPAIRQRHINTLVDLALHYGYDGLDLDYESMAAADRELFSQFVEEVAKRLHENGKLLSVTLHPKTAEPGPWSGPQSQDYARIGKAADMVKLMVYDYSYSGGPAGPVSPLNWGDQVLQFACKLIPANKLMYGLPWYGYDWPGGKTTATSVNVTSARQLASNTGAEVKRDAAAEPFFTYKDTIGRQHTVYFQDGQSYTARLQMMQTNHADMLGVAHWQIGNEAPELWEALATWQRSAKVMSSSGQAAPGAKISEQPVPGSAIIMPQPVRL